MAPQSLANVDTVDAGPCAAILRPRLETPRFGGDITQRAESQNRITATMWLNNYLSFDQISSISKLWDLRRIYRKESTFLQLTSVSFVFHVSLFHVFLIDLHLTQSNRTNIHTFLVYFLQSLANRPLHHVFR